MRQACENLGQNRPHTKKSLDSYPEGPHTKHPMVDGYPRVIETNSPSNIKRQKIVHECLSHPAKAWSLPKGNSIVLQGIVFRSFAWVCSYAKSIHPKRSSPSLPTRNPKTRQLFQQRFRSRVEKDHMLNPLMVLSTSKENRRLDVDSEA